MSRIVGIVITLLVANCGDEKEPDLAGAWNADCIRYNGIMGSGTMRLDGSNHDLTGNLDAGDCRSGPILAARASDWDGEKGTFVGQMDGQVIYDGTFEANRIVFKLGRYANESSYHSTITATR